MKLVIQYSGNVKVKNIKEYEIKKYIKIIKSAHNGKEVSPLKYEIFRYKFKNGTAIIYKDNKKLRTRNIWYEIRALCSLSQILQTPFYHQIKFKGKNGLETEIDGLDVNLKEIMVEIKYSIINQKWIDYYAKKRQTLGLKNCIIIAPKFNESLKIPPNISCYRFLPDIDALIAYYNNDFNIPFWIKPYISSRHVRILLNNGRWIGIKRKLTYTAKHTPESKLKLFINYLLRINNFPVKIYYSLSPMLIPVEEYYGKGRPLPLTLAAFDVDSDPHQHIIGKEGYCLKCLENSNRKANTISEIFLNLGLTYKRVYSGSKGYHFYILDDKNDKAKELSIYDFDKYLQLFRANQNEELIDNFNFRAKDGTYDLHRIFKLPHSIDFSTGIIVQEKFRKIKFKDTIEYIE